ncbi:MSHA biogenesis protein MshF [Vibrio neptunius]|uniref:MSHA biogenesis protein MshF n=1 Tax=Vibrio neptunius TaxID=170651 RepID=A0ABS3A1R2_9VIBR|nr:MSHA biogenesis protein MshF [Vibrio neptunius]MBN3493508.1 MSHA biogenesis protein MshF [Vibrio neptunius]MBN3516033.1 MSHA biogenesis protein MshF [Vibrio neptunius]MBN3550276.1 MSHA biogenesis protein MshF [Vibrio neptunius]MBN3578338.1 MSHA biogenesis protein MshF [Vibrio neptunius]MCH9872002.1 MSHA biogenesis protein MshF [Vibrio neptunius]
MAGGIQRSRLVVWLSTIIILLLSFVLVLEKLEQDVDDAAFLLASKRIIERASFYKQQWMLKGQRESLIVENQSLVFSETGWVLPKMSEKNKQCMYWLSLLYPKLSILDSMPLKVVNRSELNNYQCDYIYTQGKSIHIQLVDNTFTVSVGFSST